MVFSSAQGRPYAEMTYRELIAYKNNCPVNRTALKTIDLPRTRVAILHGLDDRLVPYQCSVQLSQKLRFEPYFPPSLLLIAFQMCRCRTSPRAFNVTRSPQHDTYIEAHD